MRKLMAVFAHPDDEGACGGALAHYAAEGVEVMLVCATRGEVGQISDPALATPETLGQVREQELAAACDILGVQQLAFLDYRDSGMQGTPENQDPRSLMQANPEEVVGKLVGLIRQQRPDVLITFEPFGWYGHPDHVAVSRYVGEAFRQAADEGEFREKGPAWQIGRLFHAVMPISDFEELFKMAVAAGYMEEDHSFGDLPREQLLQTEAAVTHVLDVTDLLDLKLRAAEVHLTQTNPNQMFNQIPEEMIGRIWGREYFIQVCPEPDAGLTAKPLRDLFAGM